MANVFNFIGFQLVWFSVILAAANGTVVLAYLATLLFGLLQLYFSRWRLTDGRLMLLGLAAGMMLDTIWLNLGWIGYAATTETGLAPAWIGCLWINFMLTLTHSLSWLQQRTKLVVILTLFAAPLSYLAGSKLGAVSFVQPGVAVLALSVSWALMVPMLISLAHIWQRQEQEGKHALV